MTNKQFALTLWFGFWIPLAVPSVLWYTHIVPYVYPLSFVAVCIGIAITEVLVWLAYRLASKWVERRTIATEDEPLWPEEDEPMIADLCQRYENSLSLYALPPWEKRAGER